MASPEAKRKLTAVLVAEVVRYSRLMAHDHLAIVKPLGGYRKV